MNNEEKILEMLSSLTSQVSSLTSQVSSLTSQVSSLTGQVSSLTGQVSSLTGQVSDLTKTVDKMQEDIGLIKVQLKEHGEVLSSLQKASEFHKSDIDNLTHQVAKLEGTVNTLAVNMDKRMTALEEDNKSIKEILGTHEVEIHNLKRLAG